MRIIWKFPLKLGSQPLKVPKGSRILTVQIQHGTLMLWALVDPQAIVPFRLDTIHVIGTGNDLPDVVEKFEYIATVQEGGFVWHVFKEVFA